MIQRRRLLQGIAAGLLAPVAPRILRASPIGLSSPFLGKAAAGGYTPQAVHFDGATYSTIASLSCTDSGVFSSACVVRIGSSLNTYPFAWGNFDTAGAFFYYDNSGGSPNASQAGVGNNNDEIYQNFPLVEGAYYLFIMTTDLQHYGPPENFPAGSATGRMIVIANQVQIGSEPNGFEAAGTLTSSDVTILNGNPFYIGNASATPGSEFTGDMVYFWGGPNVSFLDGTGAIPLATIRKFIDGSGNLVSLGANGELVTGTPPAMFFAANPANAASFGTNRGTGGAATTTGTLTLASYP